MGEKWRDNNLSPFICLDRWDHLYVYFKMISVTLFKEYWLFLNIYCEFDSVNLTIIDTMIIICKPFVTHVNCKWLDKPKIRWWNMEGGDMECEKNGEIIISLLICLDRRDQRKVGGRMYVNVDDINL